MILRIDEKKENHLMTELIIPYWRLGSKIPYFFPVSKHTIQQLLV